MNFPTYCIQQIVVKLLLVFIVISLLVLIFKDVSYMNKNVRIHDSFIKSYKSNEQLKHNFQSDDNLHESEKDFLVKGMEIKTDPIVPNNNDVETKTVMMDDNLEHKSSTEIAEIGEDSTSIITTIVPDSNTRNAVIITTNAAINADSINVSDLSSTVSDSNMKIVTGIVKIDTNVTAAPKVDATVTGIAKVDSSATGFTNINTDLNVAEIAKVDSNVTGIAKIDSSVTGVANINTDLSVTEIAKIDSNVTGIAKVDTNVTEIAKIDSSVTGVTNINTDLSVTEIAKVDSNITGIAKVDTNVTEITKVDSNLTGIANINLESNITRDTSMININLSTETSDDKFNNISTLNTDLKIGENNATDKLNTTSPSYNNSSKTILTVASNDTISTIVQNSENSTNKISPTDKNDFISDTEEQTEYERFDQLGRSSHQAPVTTALKRLVNGSFSNTSTFDETVLSDETLKKLKNIIQCEKTNYVSEVKQKGEYWVYINYVKADHGNLECYQDVTLTTHGSFPFLDNLEILVQRWSSPISIAVYTPGTDFSATLDCIQYFRQCSSQKSLIRQWVTFHLYFHEKYTPDNIAGKMVDDIKFNCSLPPPYAVENVTTFRNKMELLYPVNVGRNIARDAALTYYIFSLDIELYPVPHLGARFLNMLAGNPSLIQGARPRVFAIKPFEVRFKSMIPDNKEHLIEMLNNKSAIMFHQKVCPRCHMSPLTKEWIEQGQTEYMGITGVGKRMNRFASWEAIFISTKNDPQFEERLSWEGKSDKMAQSYIMCLLDYDFLLLSNAFVIHRPGIKTFKTDKKRVKIVIEQNRLIKNVIKNEYIETYGYRRGCEF